MRTSLRLFKTICEKAGSLKHAKRVERDRDVLPGVKAIGRNAPCPCGSGRKFKRCCLMLAKGFVPCVMKDGKVVANVPGGPRVIGDVVEVEKAQRPVFE
jgi:SEC-C motif